MLQEKDVEKIENGETNKIYCHKIKSVIFNVQGSRVAVLWYDGQSDLEVSFLNPNLALKQVHERDVTLTGVHFIDVPHYRPLTAQEMWRCWVVNKGNFLQENNNNNNN